MFKKEIHGAVHVVTCDEPLIETSVDELGEIAESLLATGQPLSVFDMSSVSLIDSAGLEALLDIKDAFESRGGYFKLAQPTPLCQDILTVTGVAKEFELFEHVADAVGSFSK